MKSLITRTITGAIYVAAILAAILIHPVGLKILVCLMNYIAMYEFNRIGRKINIYPAPASLLLNTIFTIAALTIMHFGIFRLLGVPLLLLYIIIILTISLYQKEGNPMISAAFTFLGMLWITVPLIVLNLIQESAITHTVPYSLAIFIFLWANDSFAYLAGITWGRHKLFEKISPKKSWEGFFGGLIMTLVSAVVINHFFPSGNVVFWIIFAFLTAIAAVFGDFAESLLKRIADVKDSGILLPGHGGMLDRIDSLLFAAPVIYIYLSIFLMLK